MKSIWGLFILFSSFLSHAGDVKTIYVNPSQSSFVIALPANPTTGYQMTIKKYDKKLLNLKQAKFQASDSKLVGSGGEMQFTFTLRPGKVYPKETAMTFSYARSWDPKSASLLRVNVLFQKDALHYRIN